MSHLDNIGKENMQMQLNEILDWLPENRPLYKDSGRWQIRSDDMDDVICQQQVNESFKEFLFRYSKEINLTTLF